MFTKFEISCYSNTSLVPVFFYKVAALRDVVPCLIFVIFYL